VRNRLTRQDIRELVQRAREEHRPLDHLLAETILPRGKKPIYDRDWPPEARRLWLVAVDIWFEQRRQEPKRPERTRRRCEQPPTLEDTWSVILEAAPVRGCWWNVPGLTWPQIAAQLGVSARVCVYHFCDVFGWRFTGRGAFRRVTHAPCRRCGRVRSVTRLDADGACVDRNGNRANACAPTMRRDV
jgi:hypothetical protein